VNAAYAIVALPLAGFLINLALGRRLGEPLSGWVGTIASFASFGAALATFANYLSRPGTANTVHLYIFSWIPVGGLHVNFGLQVDALSMTMALFVTGVASLIHLYSIGYMEADPGFARFFVYLNLFLFSMLVLALADNFLFTFLGWEGVGFCSYGLVGFWFDRETAAVAAKKAFVTNRVGDFGFLVAMFFMFFHFGSLSYSVILGGYHNGHAYGLLAGAPGAIPGSTATAIGLLLLLGAAGKSAQGPLYMWLPDAMEGPTPISALIHAATMVTAGVYLMSRAAPLLHYSPSARLTVASVGAATCFFAATVACTQNDIKRVLAYSTLSQLGYMFLGVGSGGYTAGLFHMITHAFFKALLFLAAGSVIHALADEQNMKKMGGLARYMPVTTVTFGIAWLAISGIPPFSGFWSKDQVLGDAWAYNKALWAVGFVTVFLTAYYMSRQVALTFLGQARWLENRPAPAVAGQGTSGATTEEIRATSEATEAGGAGTEERSGAGGYGAGAVGPGGPGAPVGDAGEPHAGGAHAGGHGTHGGMPHDPRWEMRLPLIILGVLALAGGLVNLPFPGWSFLDRFLAPVFPPSIAPPIALSTRTSDILSAVTSALAVVGLIAGLTPWRRRAERPALEPAFLEKQWYVDPTLALAVSGPFTRFADGLAYGLDALGIDGLVRGVARSTATGGRLLRRLQTGYLRNYALGIGLGTVAMLVYLTVRVGS
jgi:NADH-quinone oxidoreductase subunit L